MFPAHEPRGKRMDWWRKIRIVLRVRGGNFIGTETRSQKCLKGRTASRSGGRGGGKKKKHAFKLAGRGRDFKLRSQLEKRVSS